MHLQNVQTGGSILAMLLVCDANNKKKALNAMFFVRTIKYGRVTQNYSSMNCSCKYIKCLYRFKMVTLVCPTSEVLI